MGGSITIINDTNTYIEVDLKVIFTYHTNIIAPKEIFTFKTGIVWFTVCAQMIRYFGTHNTNFLRIKPSNNRNRTSVNGIYANNKICLVKGGVRLEDGLVVNDPISIEIVDQIKVSPLNDYRLYDKILEYMILNYIYGTTSFNWTPEEIHIHSDSIITDPHPIITSYILVGCHGTTGLSSNYQKIMKLNTLDDDKTTKEIHLSGITHDVSMMTRFIDDKLKSDEFKGSIEVVECAERINKKFLKSRIINTIRNSLNVFIYFSGHGVPGTLWLGGETLEIRDLREFSRLCNGKLILVIDSCHSGSFIDAFDNDRKVMIQSSTCHRTPSYASRDGSEFTKYYLGKSDICTTRPKSNVFSKDSFGKKLINGLFFMNTK